MCSAGRQPSFDYDRRLPFEPSKRPLSSNLTRQIDCLSNSEHSKNNSKPVCVRQQPLNDAQSVFVSGEERRRRRSLSRKLSPPVCPNANFTSKSTNPKQTAAEMAAIERDWAPSLVFPTAVGYATLAAANSLHSSTIQHARICAAKFMRSKAALCVSRSARDRRFYRRRRRRVEDGVQRMWCDAQVAAVLRPPSLAFINWRLWSS